MKKIKNLLRYLNKYNFLEEFNYLKKIAIDIDDEGLLSKLKEAKEKREISYLFDYTSLFPEGKEFVILPMHAEDEVEVENLSDSYMEKVKEAYDFISKENNSIEEIKKNPNKIRFGQNDTEHGFISIGNIIYHIYFEIIKKILGRCYNVMDLFFKEKHSYSSKFSDKIKEIRNTPIYFDSEKIFETCAKDYKFYKDKELTMDEVDKAINEFKVYLDQAEKASLVIEEYIEKAKKIEEAIEKSEDSPYKKYKVVISYDAQDIATASYNKNCGEGTSWTSCRDIGRGYDDIFRDIIEGGMIAYLVDGKEPYPIKNPFARVRIRHFKPEGDDLDPNDFILITEERVYSTSIDPKISSDFMRVVDKWVERANKKIKKENFFYVLSGDQSTDEIANVTINDKYNFTMDDLQVMSWERREKIISSLAGKLSSDYLSGNINKEKIKEFVDFVNPIDMGDELIEDPAFITPFYIKIMTTPAGKNLAYKSRQYNITWKDIEEFIKKISKAFPVFHSKIFNRQGADEGLSFLENFTKTIINYFDRFTFGERIMGPTDLVSMAGGRNKLRQLIERYIKNFKENYILDIKDDTTTEDLKFKLSELNNLNSYYSNFISDQNIEKLNNRIFNIDKQKFAHIYGELIEYSERQFEGLLKIKEVEEFLKIEANKYGHDISSHIEMLIYKPQMLHKFVRNIKKIVPNKNTHYRFLAFFARQYLNDHGFVAADNEQEVVSYIQNRTNLSEDKVYEMYNVIKISDISKFAPSWFLEDDNAVGKDFFFKKKFEYGGAIKRWTIRNVNLFSKQDAINAAKLIGLGEKQVRKEPFRSTWNVINPQNY